MATLLALASHAQTSAVIIGAMAKHLILSPWLPYNTTTPFIKKQTLRNKKRAR